MNKIARNDPCPCGSGTKYKKCCGKESVSHKRQRNSLVKKVHSSIRSSASDLFAKKVFKVLTTPAQPSTPIPTEQRGYQSLEELIGIEGAPPPIGQKCEKEKEDLS